MIAEKIIPAFYIVSVSGEATRSIIDGDFGISQITIGSTEFDCDLLAMNAVQEAVQYVVDQMGKEELDFEEKIDFNPDFFPSVPKRELTEDEALDDEEAHAQASLMSLELYDQGKFPVVLTQHFDELGDFVETKWKIDGKDFSINAKIAANPDLYIQEKAMEQITFFEATDKSTVQTNVAIH